RRLAAHARLGRPRDPRATRHGRAGALVVGAPAAQYNDRPPALVSTRAGHGALRRLRQRDRCRRTGRTPAARPGRVASASPLREGELSHLAMIGRLHYSPSRCTVAGEKAGRHTATYSAPPASGVL